MNAKDRLTSIRAELAVLEGKMTLSINEAQTMVKAKERGVDTGSRALHLHSTYINWPNSASEVILAGPSDGWITQVINLYRSLRLLLAKTDVQLLIAEIMLFVTAMNKRTRKDYMVLTQLGRNVCCNYVLFVESRKKGFMML